MSLRLLSCNGYVRMHSYSTDLETHVCDIGNEAWVDKP